VMLEAVLGEPVDLGYHVRGNQTLDSLWNNPAASDTFVTDFGDHTIALPNNHWDFLTLQSFPSVVRDPEPTLGEELARIQDFVAAADLGSQGSTEIIVYGPWAGREESRWSAWDEPAEDTLETVVEYSAAYHDLLYDRVAEHYPGRVRLASAGKVVREIRDRILAGDAPIAETNDLYRDQIHLSDTIGRFIGSTVIQTSVLGHSVVGQPVPAEGVLGWSPELIPADIAHWIQLTTWEVLLSDERSGALAPEPGDFDGNRVIDLADFELWRSVYGSAERLLADANGDGVVDAADYVVWRNAHAAQSGAVAIPEPATLLLAALALVALGRRIA